MKKLAPPAGRQPNRKSEIEDRESAAAYRW
jgi:hypothetical protein